MSGTVLEKHVVPFHEWAFPDAARVLAAAAEAGRLISDLKTSSGTRTTTLGGTMLKALLTSGTRTYATVGMAPIILPFIARSAPRNSRAVTSMRTAPSAEKR